MLETKTWLGHPLREKTWMLECMRLLASDVWRQPDVCQGDGRPIFLIPGLMGSDRTLAPLRYWLNKCGYNAYLSGIGTNKGCGQRLIEEMETRLTGLRDDTGRRVSVIGHSLGGLYSCCLAGKRPDLVEQVITLGSPLKANLDVAATTRVCVKAVRHFEYRKHPESRAKECLTENCPCSAYQYREAVMGGRVPLTSILSRRDGCVHPRSSRAEWADIVEIPKGTHIGLVVNPLAYEALGRTLAAADSVDSSCLAIANNA